MAKQYPDSVIVDKKDMVIGHMQLFDALEQGVRMRVARVFVFNERGEMLLQQRGKKVLAPLLWNEAAAGRVDEGFTYAQTALMELEEETGFLATPDDLELIDYAYQEETNGDVVARHFYKTYYYRSRDEPTIIDNDEVESFRWVSLIDLQSEFKHAPDQFTRGFIDAAQRYFDSLESKSNGVVDIAIGNH